jgi:hypothetical protein
MWSNGIDVGEKRRGDPKFKVMARAKLTCTEFE